MIQNYREQLLKITGYNFWANKRILDLIKDLDNDLLEKEIISSFSSLKKTLVHIWDAETIWYERLIDERDYHFFRKPGGVHKIFT